MTRIAIIERDRCVNGKECNFLCGKYCPINRTGAECITISEDDNKAIIDEALCNGCGICPKKCPAKCIDIVNLPEKLNEDPMHRFGVNMFELFRLPIPKKGMVVGILGRNGIGKSTALHILSGNVKPNLGNYTEPPTEEEIIQKYSNVSLGDYFKRTFAKNITVAYKPQRIEMIPKLFTGTVGELITQADEKGMGEQLLKELSMDHLKERAIAKLSGGELQRVAIIATAVKKADVYYFDEPASFCDITTRIQVAKLIRSLVTPETAVMVVEHDLATLDYISDEIQIVYGRQGAYGVVSQSKGVSRGINEYLDGYLPDDNVRFRDYSITYHDVAEENFENRPVINSFPDLEKTFDTFQLKVKSGQLRKGEVMAIMGANGLGKTTFLKILAGELQPDNGSLDALKIAYKIQYPTSDVEGTVESWLKKVAQERFESGWYKQNILEKLGLFHLMENQVKTLSGGELQKFYIAVTLSQECDIYALDEPSAFIDVEDRLKIAEVIKDFVRRNEVSAIVVDHDVQFIDYLADSMIVFEGQPGINGHVYGPVSKREGMNRVLEILDITYRRDANTLRPRINKPHSQLDKQQRAKGTFYYS